MKLTIKNINNFNNKHLSMDIFLKTLFSENFYLQKILKDYKHKYNTADIALKIN